MPPFDFLLDFLLFVCTFSSNGGGVVESNWVTMARFLFGNALATHFLPPKVSAAGFLEPNQGNGEGQLLIHETDFRRGKLSKTAVKTFLFCKLRKIREFNDDKEARTKPRKQTQLCGLQSKLKSQVYCPILPLKR